MINARKTDGKVSVIFNSRTASERQAPTEARMREVLDEMKRRRGYDNDTSYQGTKAFNGAAPSRNAYFDTKEERKQTFENGDLLVTPRKVFLRLR